jgi:hypothetical protein
MACAMRKRAAELARGWRKQGYELDFGVGIAAGYATLGQIGFEGRYDYTAIGTVVNLAARLCGEATAGQILVGGSCHGMVEELVEAESVGDLMLKGFHRPVAAFNITSLRDGSSIGAPPVDSGAPACGRGAALRAESARPRFQLRTAPGDIPESYAAMDERRAVVTSARVEAA